MQFIVRNFRFRKVL